MTSSAMTSAADHLVIFDCDGVLVDSERLAVAIDVRAVASLGWPITEAECIEHFLGRSERDVHAIIEARTGAVVPRDWEEAVSAEFRRVFAEQLQAVPGVVEAVKAVHAQGLRTCVASSGSHDKIERNLRTTGLWEDFAGRVFSASEVEHGKPAPDLFLHAARRLAVDPARCVVVEDSQYGVAAAGAAGMASVGFAGGITPRGQLAAADVVITDMADLPSAIADALKDVKDVKDGAGS